MKISKEKKSSCPYAVAIEDDERSESSSSVGGIVSQAKRSCPAFQEGKQCPFSSAKTAEDVRETLVKVPESHLKEEFFRKTLEHMHTVSPTVKTKEYLFPGGCPVQSYVNKDDPLPVALEHFSMAMIMSKIATDIGFDDSDDSDDESSVHTKPILLASQQPSSQMAEAAATATANETRRTSLSQAFKTGTTAAHQAAENVHFVSNFIRGKIDRGLYADLVLSLYQVYAALEEELDQHASQHFGTCHFPKELNRTGSLLEDVDFWHGALPSRISPATQDYIDRIRFIALKNPLLLLSHAYTRYLGDLSGGKILARVARKSLNLSRNGDGLAFYDFPEIVSLKLFKDHYRSSLDQLSLNEEQISQLVAEANIAFILNMRIFEELDVKANVPGAKVRSLEEVMDLAMAKPSNDGAVTEECPFLKKKGVSAEGDVAQSHSGKRCPWPFIFAHDPVTGLRDYQTWVVIMLVASWLWSRVQG